VGEIRARILFSGRGSGQGRVGAPGGMLRARETGGGKTLSQEYPTLLPPKVKPTRLVYQAKNSVWVLEQVGGPCCLSL
jgi:hypothetical protein